MMSLAQAHALLPGSALVGDGGLTVNRVHSDTRSLQAGDLFVALRGERFDANDFLLQARHAGAVAALAERGLVDAGMPGLQVTDSKQALGTLAAAWRARFHLPLIAVTGSNGKTTVTQMLASVLKAWWGEGAFATQGNFNNDIGVPLTLLRLRDEHRAGVVELGMNHPGEIASLAKMTAPSVALVNNAQREHQEFMATVEAVARENGTVIEALGPAGVAVFPADDEFAPLWHRLAGKRPTLTFALRGQGDVTADAQWVSQDGASDHWSLMLHTPAGFAAVQLRIAGWHNVKNALAVTACALAAGCPLEAIVRGLEAFEPVKGRSQLKKARVQGVPVTLIDDTYNANPDSARAAIEVLASLSGPRWLVLGDMGEVGDQGPAFHREVGAYARTHGIDTLWTAGALSRYAADAFGGQHNGSARHFNSVAELLSALNAGPACTSVLVKGSRFMKMEQVVAALTQTPAQAATDASPQGTKQHAA
ncbi:MAG: UDP-N-acetylmuramoyl-tripeptide--D-alanyl-D-alanine ligase [Rhizobacter sp.]